MWRNDNIDTNANRIVVCGNFIPASFKDHRRRSTGLVAHHNPERDLVIAGGTGFALINTPSQGCTIVQFSCRRQRAYSSSTRSNRDISTLKSRTIQREHTIVIAQFAIRIGRHINNSRQYNKGRSQHTLRCSSRFRFFVLILRFKRNRQLRSHRYVIFIKTRDGCRCFFATGSFTRATTRFRQFTHFATAITTVIITNNTRIG